ncbi:MAG: hypothetical protein V1723_02565 [Candidatus Uhrbacteria bacterium]
MERFPPFDRCTRDGCIHIYTIEEYDVREDGFGGTAISPDFTTPEEAEDWLTNWERKNPDKLEDQNWARRIAREHTLRATATA